jgi:hypothetical protein
MSERNTEALGERQLKALWDYYDKNKDAAMNKDEFNQVTLSVLNKFSTIACYCNCKEGRS